MDGTSIHLFHYIMQGTEHVMGQFCPPKRRGIHCCQNDIGNCLALHTGRTPQTDKYLWLLPISRRGVFEVHDTV